MSQTSAKSLWLPIGTLTLICLLSGCANAPASAQKDPAGKKPTNPALRQLPVLMQGMTTDMVREKLGAPMEIKPMEVPTGKAEIWVYRIESTVGMTQVATSMKDVPAFTVTPTGVDTVMIQNPVYTMKEEKMLITLSLLIYNGKLTARRAQAEKHEEY